MHTEHFLLYCYANFVSMNITIDNRKTDILYVDKDNNHVATNNEVIKLISRDGLPAIAAILNIIAGNERLSNNEIAILYVVMNSVAPVNYKELVTKVSDVIAKSTATVARAIESLNNKKLIYVNESNEVKVSTSISISKDALSKAKFIVIELRQDV